MDNLSKMWDSAIDRGIKPDNSELVHVLCNKTLLSNEGLFEFAHKIYNDRFYVPFEESNLDIFHDYLLFQLFEKYIEDGTRVTEKRLELAMEDINKVNLLELEEYEYYLYVFISNYLKLSYYREVSSSNGLDCVFYATGFLYGYKQLWENDDNPIKNGTDDPICENNIRQYLLELKESQIYKTLDLQKRDSRGMYSCKKASNFKRIYKEIVSRLEHFNYRTSIKYHVVQHQKNTQEFLDAIADRPTQLKLF